MSDDEQPNINTENMQETSKKIVDVRLYVQQSFRNGQQIKEMSNSLGIPTIKIIQLLGEEYREKVFLLYESNHNYSQIAKIVGVGHSAVNDLLNKNRVKHEISPQHRPELHLFLKNGLCLPYIGQSWCFKLKDLKKFLAPDVVFDYLRGRTITELNHYYHLNKYSIQKDLKKAGIESLDSRKTYTYRLHMNTIGGRKFGKDTFYKPLGTLIKQIIDGMLLGDGNIRINHDKSADNVPTLKEYKTALRFLKNLQTLTDITQIPDLQKTITDFNQAIRILSTLPTTVFRVGKSVLELRYVTDGLIKKFEEAKYTCKAFLSLNKIKKLINDTHVYKIYC